MIATANFVVLANFHVNVIIQTRFSFVTATTVFQCFGNSSVTDMTPTTNHIMATKSQIMPLLP